jgi:hypothetical protein
MARPIANTRRKAEQMSIDNMFVCMFDYICRYLSYNLILWMTMPSIWIARPWPHLPKGHVFKACTLSTRIGYWKWNETKWWWCNEKHACKLSKDMTAPSMAKGTKALYKPILLETVPLHIVIHKTLWNTRGQTRTRGIETSRIPRGWAWPWAWPTNIFMSWRPYTQSTRNPEIVPEILKTHQKSLNDKRNPGNCLNKSIGR